MTDLLDEKDFGLPRVVQKGFPDPALLTFKEFYAVTNEDRKSHPSHAYNLTLAQMNQFESNGPAAYPRLINRIKANGMWFEVRLRSDKRQYIKRGPDDKPLVIDGQTQMFTDEEVKAFGGTPVIYDVGMFNEEGQRVGYIDGDEWGCVLVVVAQEYRKFGFGPYLGKLARTIYPDRPSGGFTPQGFRNIQKVHAQFVRDAMAAGVYSKLVQSGEMTARRARMIIDSVTEPRAHRTDIDLSSTNPESWMVYEEHGAFVIYDKKLKDFDYSYDSEHEHHLDKMIRGLVFVFIYEDRFGILRAFGGETPEIKRLLLDLAASYCANEKITLVVDADDVEFVDPKRLTLSKPNYKTGYERFEAKLVGAPFPYEGLVRKEQLFRKTFDQYEEFKSQILERAFGKFGPPA